MAGLAKRIAIAEKVEKKVADECFLAGLLHEIGTLILEDNFSEEYVRARELSNSKDIPLYQAEHEIFGTTHGAVGAYLLGLWSLNDAVVEAVAFHHQPQLSGGSAFSPLIAVHVADMLVQRGYIDAIKPTAEESDLALLKDIGFEERLETWKSLLSTEGVA